MTLLVSRLPRARKPGIRKNRELVVPAAILSVLLTAAIVVRVIWAQEVPIDFAAILAPPSLDHLLGTDQLGRDLLVRLLLGAADSLIGPVLLMMVAAVIGLSLGLLQAWFRGPVDAVITRMTDVLLAFPGILFVVLVIAVLGSGMPTVIVALGIAYAPVIARYTRSLARAELERPYIEAAKLQGRSSTSILFLTVLPNLLPQLIGYLVILLGDALLSIAALSYLGFGAQPPSSEWGLMANEGQAALLQGYLLPTLVPVTAILIVTLCVNILGLRVAERLEVGNE